MGNINYRPLIDDMVWSYSRLQTYEDCPYGFFLKYIRGCEDLGNFYSEYGSFCHKLLAEYYKGEVSKSELPIKFLLDFQQEVTSFRPQESTVQKYISGACEYFRNFEPFPYETVAVEKKINFKISNYNFIGFVDYIGKNQNGELVIVDNKSRDLKPRSKRAKLTANDKELDKMLKQLYLYAIAVEQEYGAYPTELCFNCFRTSVYIKEHFDMAKLEETKQWAIQTINQIERDDVFEPEENYFRCSWLCGCSGRCKYNIEAKEEHRNR